MAALLHTSQQQMICILCSIFLLIFKFSRSQVTDPLTRWTEIISQPMPYAASILFTGYDSSSHRIWLIGGNNDRIMSYNITSNSWTYHGTFSTTLQLGAVTAQCSAQWGDDSIMFIDAATLRQFSFNSIALTNTNNPLLHPREAPCVAIIYSDWIFATSGVIKFADAENPINYDSSYLQILDNRGPTAYWYRGPNMIDSRAQHACVAHNDYMYVFGGVYAVAPSGGVFARISSEKIYIGDMPNIGSWSKIDYIQGSNVHYHRAVVDDLYNQIYLIGGRDSYEGIASDNIQIYDISTDTMELRNGAGRLNTARSSPAVVIIDHKIYVFGGLDPVGGEYASWETSNILTFHPTASPTNTTYFPTYFPTKSPTNIPTKSRTYFPTTSPTYFPTNTTYFPTYFPTKSPTDIPTYFPTYFPTISPTLNPLTLNADGAVGTTSDSNKVSIDEEQNNGNNIRITGMTLILFIIIGVFAAIIVVGCILFFLYRSKLKSILAAIELNSSPEEDTDVCYDGIDNIQSDNIISNDNDLISMVNTTQCVDRSGDSGKTDGNVYDNNTLDGPVSVGQTDKEKHADLYAMSAAAVIQSAQLDEQMAIEERNKEESQEEGFNVDQFFAAEKSESNELNENNTTTRDGRTTIGGANDVTHGGDDVHNQ